MLLFLLAYKSRNRELSKTVSLLLPNPNPKQNFTCLGILNKEHILMMATNFSTTSNHRIVVDTTYTIICVYIYICTKKQYPPPLSLLSTPPPIYAYKIRINSLCFHVICFPAADEDLDSFNSAVIYGVVSLVVIISGIVVLIAVIRKVKKRKGMLSYHFVV